MGLGTPLTVLNPLLFLSNRAGGIPVPSSDPNIFVTQAAYNKLYAQGTTGAQLRFAPLVGVAGYNFNTPITSTNGPIKNRIRGLMVAKGAAITDVNNVLVFQFNPMPITDNKQTDYIPKGYTGMDGDDYYWIKGGERTVNFSLMFDATAGSNTPYLSRTGAYGNAGNDNLKYLRSYQDGGKPRGTLDDVEKLQGFCRPVLENSNTPRFTSGAVIPAVRFMPPPVVIFSFGDIYLECIVANVNVTHQVFDSNLLPVRSEAQVALKIIETYIPTKNNAFVNYTG